jgi:hypothetical protein
MKYTVIWLPQAENQLARIWIQATDRQNVTDATNRIDLELATDAHTKGNPLGIFHTYSDDPLAVLFHVDPSDCLVRVIQVRRTK